MKKETKNYRNLTRLAGACEVTSVLAKSPFFLKGKLNEMSRNNEMENQCENDIPCTAKPRKWGIPGRRTVEHEPIMASKLIKPRHNADTPGQKGRVVYFL